MTLPPVVSASQWQATGEAGASLSTREVPNDA